MSLNLLTKRKTILSGVALAGVAVISFNNPASAVSPGHLRPANTGAYADSVSGGYVLGAENLASGNPFNDYAMEGIVANDVGGVGMLGYGIPAKSYGVYGVTFGTNGIGVYGAGDGPTPAPGNTPGSNQSTGVVGNSASGDGVYGSTQFPNPSGDAFGESPVAGVMGVDVTTNGDENNGVVGITTNGGYGVVGFSSDAAPSGGSDIAALGGVEGTATGGTGVEGISKSGSGVYGSSSTNTGGNFFSGSGYGATGQTDSSTAGVYGGNTGTGYGVWGSGKSTGPGVYALNTSTGEGLLVRNSAGTSAYAADISNTTSGSGFGLVSQADSYAIVGRSNANPLGLTDDSDNLVFRVDSAGDVYYNGTLNSEARTRSGYTASTYSARMSTPTVEDVGTGNIVNGQGLVRLDPVLVEQMDRSTMYHVLITPDGDTRGLYVATKTAQGFVVRETQGGHGTLAFDYRIVANVDGQASRRMSLSMAGPSQISTSTVSARVVRGTPGLALMPPATRAQSAKEAAAQNALRRSASATRARVFVPQANVAAEQLRHN
jgi:hypothetical protein